MQQLTKKFSEVLNTHLNELDMPESTRERAIILSKILDIPKQHAWNLLEGHLYPDEQLLQKIANLLEVDANSLKNKH